MRRIYLALIFFINILAAKSQNHGTVKAVILDSLTNQPIPLATVSVLQLKDTSLVSYTVTDKNGAFTLRNLREEPSLLLISHVGYRSKHINLKFIKGEVTDLGKLLMSAPILRELIVKGERIPIIIKKDTIEFDAEAFKTRPNALVEDLLKKLPGVQVDLSGKITVNGIDVSKIKVNGKTFFANDLTIATRNLEANMISKVQVYDDRENDPDHLVPEYDVKKIINLKFKKEFAKGLLTTIGAGGGTQDRYVASGFGAKFQDDLQLSVKLNSDNLSSSGYFNGNYGGFSTFAFGNPGIQTTHSGNLDFTEDISKKLKLHVEYKFNNSTHQNTSNAQSLQNISDTIFNTLTQSMQHRQTDNQSFNAEMEYKPDSLTIIRYVPGVEYNYGNNVSESTAIKSNTYFPLLDTNFTSDHGNSSSFQYQHNLSYYRKLNKKGASLTLTNTFSTHPQKSLDFNINNLVSNIAALPSDTLNRSATNAGNDVSVGLTANYHYPLTKKLSADIIFVSLYDQNSGNLVTYDQDFKTGLYTIFLTDQSSGLVRGLWGEGITPQLTYNFTDNVSIKAGLTSLAQQIDNHFNNTVKDLNQNFFYPLPSAEIHIKNTTLIYAESVQQPSINNLQPITIVYSPLYTFIGNPQLKPTYFHNIGLQYRKYNNPKGLSFDGNMRVTVERNTVVNEQTISAEGASVTTPVNRSGRFTAYLYGAFSKRFKKQNKWDFTFAINVNTSAGHNFFIVNQQNGYQNTQNIMFNSTMFIQWNDLISFQPSYHIHYAMTQYKLVNYPGDSFTTQGAESSVDISLPKDFRWRVSYNYSFDPLVAPGFQRNTNLLNLSITKRIQKGGKGEIGLICYDMLNQNVSVNHYVVANTINTIQNEVLKRYVLLTYTYHFNKFK